MALPAVVADGLGGSTMPRSRCNARRRRALDRAHRTAHDLGHLRLGQIVEIAQHERHTLAHGASSPRAFVRSVLLSTSPSTVPRAVVLMLPHRMGAGVTKLVAPARVMPTLVEGEVHEDLAGVCSPVLHGANPGPLARHTQEAFLHEILRCGEIPGDQVRGPEQPVDRVPDELVELLVAPGRTTPATHPRGLRGTPITPISTLRRSQKVAPDGQVGPHLGKRRPNGGAEPKTRAPTQRGGSRGTASPA